METIKFIIDQENNNVRTVGATHSVKGNVDGNINFYEAGIDGLTDREEIEEALIELNEDQYDEVLVEFIGSDFSKNFKAKVSISDLEKLGWNFEYDDTSEAMNMSLEEAEKHVKETYSVEITVNEDGKTLWRYTNNSKSASGINEGSDNEETGDDEQTIKDLKKLHAEGKLWGEENFIG